jgi:peptide/nickel transport system ATP-binding protein
MSSAPVLSVRGVTKVFRGAGRRAAAVVAVRDVSFDLGAREVVALVGESGSGKTTIGRIVAGVETPTVGEARLAADGAVAGPGRRRRVQMVFQDPYAALNPFNTVAYAIGRPLINHQGVAPAAARARVAEMLATVQLTPPEEYLDKRPHQLSGGQRQRVVVARALAAGPDIVVADEPVSMLDVSIRADILQLLKGALDTGRVQAMLYITHDLLSARLVAHRVLVLYRGHLVEVGATAAILNEPAHPYTRLLWAAIPNPRRAARGERTAVPVTAAAAPTPSDGCPFAPRCPLVVDRCRHERPSLATTADGRAVACHVVAPLPAATAG